MYFSKRMGPGLDCFLQLISTYFFMLFKFVRSECTCCGNWASTSQYSGKVCSCSLVSLLWFEYFICFILLIVIFRCSKCELFLTYSSELCSHWLFLGVRMLNQIAPLGNLRHVKRVRNMCLSIFRSSLKYMCVPLCGYVVFECTCYFNISFNFQCSTIVRRMIYLWGYA